jgi:predicted glycosyltransferase
MMVGRVLFYVQHLLGIGHLQRAATIARAMSAAGLEVDFVSGGERTSGLDIGNARLRQLPPAKAADSEFSAILDQSGRPIDEVWRADRCALVLSLYRAIRPDAVLIEMFPFGRRQFRFELIPLLEAALADHARPFVATSVRDILVEKKNPARLAETLATLRKYFAAAFVHADPSFVRLDRTFAPAKQIEDLIHYTGFVVERPGGATHGPSRDLGEVLVSAGGGAVGRRLLETALAARPLSRYRDHAWRFITGANLDPAADAELRKRAQAQSGLVIETYRPDFREMLGRCAASISQAGYNTLLEVVAHRCPAVVVPFATQSESEQTQRARLFAERGLLEMVEEAHLSPETLARALDRAVAPMSLDIDLAGAEKTASAIVAKLKKRAETP